MVIELALLGTLVYKVLDALKYLRAKDTNAFITQVVSWAVGTGVLALAAASTVAGGIEVGGKAITDLNFADTLLLGSSVASFASVGYDFRKAFDNTDGAKAPPLLDVSPD